MSVKVGEISSDNKDFSAILQNLLGCDKLVTHDSHCA